VDDRSADDLAQETFVSAIRAVRRFRGDSSARTWLLSIAHRRCVDELRTRTRRRALGSTGAEHVPLAVDVSADPAETVVVHDTLARLEPDRRAAFVLTQILRMSYAEAGAVCGCPVGTVRSRVARARDDLIRQMAEAPRDGPAERGAGSASRA